MGRKKAPNPNTAYGRKRIREENAQWRASLSPQERKEADFNGCIVYVVILLVIIVIVYLIGGTDGVLKWLSH